MTEYYDTTPEQVAAEAEALGLSRPLTHALLERGHKPEAIRGMSPEGRFREYCEWHGLIGWSSHLLEAARSAGVVMNPDRAVMAGLSGKGPVGKEAW